MTMHDQTTQAISQDETTIERKLTFRNSTYGGLKAFIRAHKRRTGVELTNSAAVDLLLRERLARELHPAAFGEVLKLSRPSGLHALQAKPSGDPEDAPGTSLADSRSGEDEQGSPSPAASIRPLSGVGAMDVSVRRERPFLRRECA